MVFFIGIIVCASILAAFISKPESKNQAIQAESTVSFPFPNFGLDIPKLSIKAPIISDVPGNNKEIYFESLKKGVAHFEGTSKPGQDGLIFIFGHSSFFSLAEGDYKEVFKNLDELSEGDEIIIWYRKKEFKYKVRESKIVSPDDLTVLEQTPTEQLTLMTCYPPGTKEKRLIVNADPLN